MKEKVLLLKLKSIEDLARLVCNMPVAIIYHAKLNNKHLYFYPWTSGGVTLIHYIEKEKPIEKKFVAYNSLTDQVCLTDEVSTDARLRYIPIIEVEYQNIIKAEELT